MRRAIAETLGPVLPRLKHTAFRSVLTKPMPRLRLVPSLRNARGPDAIGSMTPAPSLGRRSLGARFRGRYGPDSSRSATVEDLGTPLTTN